MTLGGQAYAIFAQLLQAVSYLHDNGVLQADIKFVLF